VVNHAFHRRQKARSTAGPEHPRHPPRSPKHAHITAYTMKYFFHLEDGACIRDQKGSEFPDDAAAMREAEKIAREFSTLPVHAYEWSVVVKNADGLRVGSVPLLPALAIDAERVFPPPRSIQ